MKRLSNLPPGVTDQMIEDAQGNGDTVSEHPTLEVEVEVTCQVCGIGATGLVNIPEGAEIMGTSLIRTDDSKPADHEHKWGWAVHPTPEQIIADLLAALKEIAGERFTPQAGHNAFKLDGMLSEVQDLATAAVEKGERT